jgi:hypothetical protein
MLVTLKHFFVTLGLMSGSLLIVPALQTLATRWGLCELAGNAAAFVIALSMFVALCWPIYRLFRLRPLILPICPHCQNRHGNYHIDSEAWPDGVLICIHCQRPVRLLLAGNAAPEDVSDMPVLRLKWPKFLGLWKPARARIG